jgi:hypothetical protein
MQSSFANSVSLLKWYAQMLCGTLLRIEGFPRHRRGFFKETL